MEKCNMSRYICMYIAKSVRERFGGESVREIIWTRGKCPDQATLYHLANQRGIVRRNNSDISSVRNYYRAQRRINSTNKGAITSKINHAIKLKTSPARLAQLVSSFIACFILLVIAP